MLTVKQFAAFTPKRRAEISPAYIDGQFTPLSKPFDTKEQAKKARLKYSEKERKTIGVGFIRMES